MKSMMEPGALGPSPSMEPGDLDTSPPSGDQPTPLTESSREAYKKVLTYLEDYVEFTMEELTILQEIHRKRLEEDLSRAAGNAADTIAD